MSLLDDCVFKDEETGTWKFECVKPVDSPCGIPGGPGFVSSGWPTKKSALARGEQHFAEHRGEGTVQQMHEFLADQGLGVDERGGVFVKDLK